MQLACVCPFQIFQNFPLQCSQVECLLDTDEMDDSPLLFTLSDVGQHGITVRSGWISHRQGWMNTCFKHNFIQVETLARTPWFKRDVKIGWSSLRIFTFLGAQICGRFKSGAQIGRQRPENWARTHFNHFSHMLNKSIIHQYWRRFTLKDQDLHYSFFVTVHSHLVNLCILTFFFSHAK